VRSAVARALGLGAPPALEEGPAQILGWDSLGALRVLLSVEDEFAIRLDERDMARVRQLADLVGIVEARTRAAPSR
jgi:acyl carrier protein